MKLIDLLPRSSGENCGGCATASPDASTCAASARSASCSVSAWTCPSMPARAGASSTPAISAASTARGAAGGCSPTPSTLRRSPSPRCSNTERPRTTLSTASRGGCSPAPSTPRRTPRRDARGARRGQRRALRRPAGRPASRGRRRSLPALVRFRAGDEGQCSDTAASLPASPLDLTRTLASPCWQPYARRVIREIVGQHDTCCDYHRLDRDRPDPVPTRSPPLRHTRRASRRNTNAIKTTSKRPSISRKKTRSPTVFEARATLPPRPTTRRCLTTTSMKTPRCASAASSTGPPQPPCTENAHSETRGLAVRFRPRCPNDLSTLTFLGNTSPWEASSLSSTVTGAPSSAP